MPPPRRPHTAWLDLVSIAASGACLIHCLLLPLLFAMLPAAARLLALPEGVHVLALLTAIPASAIAMTAGFRHHGLALPALFAALGLALMGAGAMASGQLLLETGLSVAGSVLLAIGHVMNWRLRPRRGTGPIPCP